MWRRIIVFLSCGLLVGVALGSLWSGIWLWLFVLLVLVLAVALFIRYPASAGLCLVSTGLIIGVLRINSARQDNLYTSRLGESINQLGRVVRDPLRTGDREELVILPEGETQKLKVTLFRNFSYAELGDTVWVRGEIAEVKNFSGFDYRAYLQRQGVYAELKKPRVIVVRRAKLTPQKIMITLRHYLSSKASQIYPEPASYLIMGILLGQKRELPDSVKTNFATAGLSHLVAVSGYNMSIIAGLCAGLAWYIGRRATNVFTIALVWSFVLLVGMSASVVRAAIMASLISLAQLLGRGYAGSYALLVTAVLMVLQNPLILIWDIGFQLSFMATFGVMIAGQLWAPNESSWWSSGALTTLGAIAFTAPLVAWHFQTFSLVSPIANLMALPLVPPLMLFSALGLLPIVGQLPAVLALYLAKALLWIAEFSAQQSFASIQLQLPFYWYGLIYVILISVTYFLWRNQRLSATKDNVKI